MLLTSCGGNRTIVTYGTYSSDNLDFIPYSYHNVQQNFIGYDGDYMKIRLNDTINLRMVCAYNNTILSLSVSSDDLSLKDLEINVNSSKNGELKRQEQTERQLKYNSVSFSKGFLLKAKSDIISKVKNDTITVSIDTNKFEFISPKS